MAIPIILVWLYFLAKLLVVGLQSNKADVVLGIKEVEKKIGKHVVATPALVKMKFKASEIRCKHSGG